MRAFSSREISAKVEGALPGQKERIVTEPSAPPPFGQQGSFAGSGKGFLEPLPDQGKHATETAPAFGLGDFPHLREHLVVVGFVVAVQARIAGGNHAGAALQGIDLDPAVIGEKPAFAGSDPWQSVSLEQGVGFEGGAGLLDLGHPSDRIRSAHFDGEPPLIEGGLQFMKFVGVARGKVEGWS